MEGREQTWNEHTLQATDEDHLHWAEPAITQLVALLYREAKFGGEDEHEEARADELQDARQIGQSYLQTKVLGLSEPDDVPAINDCGRELNAQRDHTEHEGHTQDHSALCRGSCSQDDADL